MRALTTARLAAALALLALAACVEAPPPVATEPEPPPDPALLRYAAEYPAVGYGTRPLSGRIADAAARAASGELALAFDAERGYLDALLAALEIDPASQVLVFSTTSLQVGGIGPATPRAIYFNDDTYVAWVPGARTLEIASMDPQLGPVFHTLTQRESAAPEFEHELARCLRCHDSYSLTGGGVPRLLLGSGYIGTRGEIVSHEAWIVTGPRTPLRIRWGGWYVTGRHGDQVHLGNIVVRDPAALGDLESLRIGNRDDLDGLVDHGPYPTRYSDIVALLVLEHQIAVQNALTRARFEVLTAIGRGLAGSELEALVAEHTEPLVRELLMSEYAELADTIRGTSGFAAAFEARGPRDSSGRSLRELDLERRLFRYPLSYLVYSDAFDALPAPVLDRVASRLAEILTGRDSRAQFDHLSGADRGAVLEILRETKPELLPRG